MSSRRLKGCQRRSSVAACRAASGSGLCHRRESIVAPVDALGLDAQRARAVCGRQSCAGAPCPADRSALPHGRCAGGGSSGTDPWRRLRTDGRFPAAADIGGIDHQHRMGCLHIGQQTEAQRPGIDEWAAASPSSSASARRSCTPTPSSHNSTLPKPSTKAVRGDNEARAAAVIGGGCSLRSCPSRDVTCQPRCVSIDHSIVPPAGSVRFRTDPAGGARLRSAADPRPGWALMHELSVCQALLTQVSEIAVGRGATAVSGSCSRSARWPVSSRRCSSSAFAVVRAGSCAADAVLSIESPAVIVRCLTCGAQSQTAPNRLVCARVRRLPHADRGG